jgi:exosortase family protein XrtF
LSFIFVKIDLLKALIKQYRPVIRFVLVFFGSYTLLAGLYGFYLNTSDLAPGKPDMITGLVARQTQAVIQSLGYQVEIAASQKRPALNVSLNGLHVVNVVEGCNAVSVIILFIAFVLAFWRGFWRTLLFVFAGATLIYALNIVRIALLAIAIYEYPEWTDFLHGVLFPLLIYGLVFVLWVLWTRQLLVQQKA